MKIKSTIFVAFFINRTTLNNQMKFAFLSIFLLFLFANHKTSAQKTAKEFHIKKSKSAIKLDGVLDEPAWLISELADKFFLNKPYDSSYAVHQTEVKLTFDEKFLFIGVKAYQPKSSYTVSSFKRDFESGTSDVFSVNIDTFKDKLNGFQFSVTPLNVQREGLISLGEMLDISWDNKWYSQVKNYEDYYVIEMAIPFTTLRYKVSENTNSWNINFGRFYMQSNEVGTWSPVPRNFRPNNLAFAGALIWDDAPPKPGANISLIPYLSANFSQDFPRNDKLESLQQVTNSKIGVGLDAKVAVTPSLNLDLTVNPDFSQVEVDQQQTNLSRFELFFPERRQFFIENSDLFGTFGFPDTRPFFSRRIGITRNRITGLAQQVPILAGARLSGKINQDWRIGLMNMQTKRVDFGGNEFLPATNYSVAVLQRKVFNRSSIGGVFVNTERLGQNISEDLNRFNRVAGLEFNFNSKDNRLETETYYHQSFVPNGGTDASSVAHFTGYHHPNIDLNLGAVRIGKDYRAEMGYVPRTGIINLYRPATLILNPRNPRIAKFINAYGFSLEGSDVFDLNGKRLDSETPISFYFNTPGGAEFSTGYYMAFTHLFNEFDPTNASDNPNPDFSKNVKPLPIGDYRYQTVFINFETTKRKNIFGEFLYYGGEYFNGKTNVVEASVNYRLQPIGTIAMDLNYTDINLPSPYNSVKYWLIGPKAELSFNKSLFFSTFFQYNTQTNNSNINSRLQWRFKPVSDLFLVYTDNYFAQDISKYRINAWTPKNRALVLKITYWLNV
jgi:hypothetical protein